MKQKVSRVCGDGCEAAAFVNGRAEPLQYESNRTSKIVEEMYVKE